VTSGVGPSLPLTQRRSMSAHDGRPEVCSRAPVRRLVTRCMVRPRVARGFVNLADAVLHQCIRPLIGACCAPGHHGYQRAFELISGQASNGPFGSPVFACAGKTDPPSLSHSSRRPRRVRDVVTSSNAPHVALFLCSCLAAVPSSRPARADAPRARAVKAGRRAVLTSCSTAARLCLDGPEHGARIKQVGTPSHRS
jgi:hypothetical protein